MQNVDQKLRDTGRVNPAHEDHGQERPQCLSHREKRPCLVKSQPQLGVGVASCHLRGMMLPNIDLFYI